MTMKVYGACPHDCPDTCGIITEVENGRAVDFYADPDMPQVNRILTQPDMLAFLRHYHPTRRGWPLWTWLWINLCEEKKNFYHL